MIILLLFIYFLTFFCVIKIKRIKTIKHLSFPILYLGKNGIYFTSFSTHRIKINNNTKTMLVNKNLYLKTNEQLIIFSNVENIKIYNNYLYFSGCGKVNVYFDSKLYFRYFAIDIKSNQFELNNQKQIAIIDLMNSDFNILKSSYAKRYIKIIKNVLNIEISNNNVIVKPNKFKFSYVLTYKLNNKIKRVSVNEKL